MAKPIITAEQLRTQLAYDPCTGLFTRLARLGHSVSIGDVAGSTGPGYIYISLYNRRYLAHRLAWLYVYGSFPSNYIDHIDGNVRNNAIANLRNVSQSVNMQNQRSPRSNNTSGHLGVTKNKARWMSFITVESKNRYIGTFDTPEEASAAYLAAKRLLHPGCTI